jgi:PRTRC genetic system protein B
MNRELLNTTMSPKLVVIVYQDKQRYQPNYFLEKREVKNKSGKFQFGSPSPLTDNVMKEIAGSYLKKNETQMGFGGIIGEHLLYCRTKLGSVTVMWYRPATLKKLNINRFGVGKMSECTVHIPAMLYLAVDRKLYMYALMDDARPGPKTKIFKAPFYNIYEDGNVCLGTAHVGRKGDTYEGEAERFERAFFLAEQSGGHSTGNCKTPLDKLWQQLSKSKKPFPSKTELLGHKYSNVETLLSKIGGE